MHGDRGIVRSDYLENDEKAESLVLIEGIYDKKRKF